MILKNGLNDSIITEKVKKRRRKIGTMKWPDILYLYKYIRIHKQIYIKNIIDNRV